MTSVMLVITLLSKCGKYEYKFKHPGLRQTNSSHRIRRDKTFKVLQSDLEWFPFIFYMNKYKYIKELITSHVRQLTNRENVINGSYEHTKFTIYFTKISEIVLYGKCIMLYTFQT